MNRVAKKMAGSQKTQPPKRSTGAFKLPSETRLRKTSVPTLSTGLVKSANGVTPLTTKLNGQEDSLIYQRLKEEVGEFYPYPELWLEAPHGGLGGQSPLQMALSGPVGKGIVLNLIQMIKGGMFT